MIKITNRLAVRRLDSIIIEKVSGSPIYDSEYTGMAPHGPILGYHSDTFKILVNKDLLVKSGIPTEEEAEDLLDKLIRESRQID